MMHLDSVQIGSSDLAAAVDQYALLLGVEPTPTSEYARRFQLQRGAIELEHGEAGLHSLCFIPSEPCAAGHWPRDLEAFHGLHVRVASFVEHATSPPPAPDAAEAIDHVVIHSPDPQRAVALWRDRLGLRLALDRGFPARGLRILFFRSNGMTLEFVSPLEAPTDTAGPDRLTGIAYRVGNLAACRDRLMRSGVDVSEVRAGQKPGTLVATVRSATAGVPTLLIQAQG